MTTDVLAAHGGILLGSRLKRLAERLLADAAVINAEAGVDLLPGQLVLLIALDHQGPLTVGDAARAIGLSQPGITRNVKALISEGLVELAAQTGDKRERTLQLTQAGAARVARAKTRIFPGVGQAVEAMCGGSPAPMLAEIARIEAALEAVPFAARFRALTAPPDLSIVEFSDALASEFYAINAEWISALFRMEPSDIDVLSNPRDRIINPGGAILFVEVAGLGIVGACALRRENADWFELTKMGVREASRGRKAGEFLLAAMLARAKDMRIPNLYLLTNARQAAAIHLYEKHGFVHDDGVMQRFGAQYERCDVAMRYAPAPR